MSQKLAMRLLEKMRHRANVARNGIDAVTKPIRVEALVATLANTPLRDGSIG